MSTEYEFKQVREFSPQWEVSVSGESRPFARVTERVIKHPPYLVCLLVEGQPDDEHEAEDREQVMQILQRAKP